MNEISTILEDIKARVQTFCDEIIYGKIDNDILKKHKIQRSYLEICRNHDHPSSEKLKNRLFNYLMSKTGVNNHLSDVQALSEISSHIEDQLWDPKEESEEKSLKMPRFIYGVNRTLDRIEYLTHANAIEFADKEKVDNVEFRKVDRRFQLTYSKNPRISVNLEDFSTPATHIQIAGLDLIVPTRGAHLAYQQRTFTQPDKIAILIDKFHEGSLQDDKSYYFRYITEVNTDYDLFRNFVVGKFDVEGKDIFAIDVQVDGSQLLFYYYNYKGKLYLIIEYKATLTAKEMNDLCFSTLVAFGMISTDVHLNESWMAAYEDVEQTKVIGLYFQSLVPSIHCNYQIFTTNVFPSLVHVAKQIDPRGGERRACDIISNLKLSEALQPFPSDVFGRLVENNLKYEELQRGIFIILMGSSLHLEIQAATYCVALEAISNLAPKIINEKEELIINNKETWKKVKKRFMTLTKELCEEQIISDQERQDVEKKLENMNKAFNSEKLRSLLEYYHYPLRKFDELTLYLRNLLLHGSIKIKKLKDREPEDYLFELSMNLHKLCCSIALLMSGYKGYIINNRKTYNCPNSYKAFIRIGDNVKVDYLFNKEPDNFLDKIIKFGRNVWGTCKHYLGLRWKKNGV